MSKLRDAAQQALEALIAATPVKAKDPQMQADAIVALRAALAEPDHIPDAGKMVAEPCEMGAMCLNCQPRGPNGECPDAPQPRKRLTDEELGKIINANWGVGVWQMGRAIEDAVWSKKAA